MKNIEKSRDVYIWGAGSMGEKACRDLKEFFTIKGFIDSNHSKWGTSCAGYPVFSPDLLQNWAVHFEKKPFVFIASTWADEIEAVLKPAGYVDDWDYFVYFGQFDVGLFEEILKFNDLYTRRKDLSIDDLRTFSDSTWFWMNTKGNRSNKSLQNLLSPLPKRDVQIRLTGVEGDLSLRHAFNQYRIIKEILKKKEIEISNFERVLDFGCGYGRIMRFFIKDLSENCLFGTDIDESLIEWSRANNKFGKYNLNNALPPINYPSGYFSLIYSFSVFTHLSERSHLAWKDELHRILKKDGFLIFTIWSNPLKTKDYHSRYFSDYEGLVSQYNQDQFCYSKQSETYAEAFVPIKYIKEKWLSMFELVAYIEEHPDSPTQNYVILRKK